MALKKSTTAQSEHYQLRCYDLERTNWFDVLSGAYTFRVRVQAIYQTSLSDTRHTSVDNTHSGLFLI